MTTARKEVVLAGEVGVYHCITRCVRRAFLCGMDTVTGLSYEHRREWIRSRLAALLEIFSIEVIAYAVMNNHLHTLVRVRPDIANSWTDKEVARRWRLLFPLCWSNGVPKDPTEEEIQDLVRQPPKIEIYRQRLADLSWFNRCLNENIARRANREDRCKGRFWEGRFKCQRVLDTAGILTCAAYIDLNPIRAGMAKTLEGSDHTSIQDRIHVRTKTKPKRCQSWRQVPLVSISEITGDQLTVDHYMALVDETGRRIVAGKHSLALDTVPILEKLKINPELWVDTTRRFRHRFRRMIGAESKLIDAAKNVGKKWFQGVSVARQVFCS